MQSTLPLISDRPPWSASLKPWLLRALSLLSGASTLLLVYFWRIGYFPLDGLPDFAAFSALVLAAAALLTVGLLSVWCGPSLVRAGLMSKLGLRVGLTGAATAGTRRHIVGNLAAAAIGAPWLAWTLCLVFEILNLSPSGWGLLVSGALLTLALSLRLWKAHGGCWWRWSLLNLMVGLATSLPFWLLLVLSRGMT
jgi:hypothetical protein